MNALTRFARLVDLELRLADASGGRACLTPLPSTAAALLRAGVIAQDTPAGLELVAAQPASATFAGAPDALAWMLHRTDAPRSRPGTDVLHLGGAVATTDRSTGRLRLHLGETTAPEDLRPPVHLAALLPTPEDARTLLREAPHALLRLPVARVRGAGGQTLRLLIRLAPAAGSVARQPASRSARLLETS